MIHKQKFDPKDRAAWLALRQKLSGRGQKDVIRFGGSDIGTIMGYNNYISKTEFFYRATEYDPKDEIFNLAIYRGHVQEPLIYQHYWRYYPIDNPSHEAFGDNIKGEMKIYRTADEANFTATNDKYPFLFANMDRWINENEYTPQGVVEFKSVTTRAVDKFVGYAAPFYLMQVYDYMMIMEAEYGELFQSRDDTYPEVIQLYPNPSIYDRIVNEVGEFAELVLEGKKIVYDPALNLLEKEQELAHIAPEPDGSDSLTQYYTETHKKKLQTVEVEGNDEQLDKVLAYLRKKEEIKSETKKLKKLEQEIRAMFVGEIGKISFGELGAISYYGRFNCPGRILEKANELNY